MQPTNLRSRHTPLIILEECTQRRWEAFRSDDPEINTRTRNLDVAGYAARCKDGLSGTSTESVSPLVLSVGRPSVLLLESSESLALEEVSTLIATANNALC